MSPIAQRNAVVNFIKNKGDTAKPDGMSSDVIDRLIHERGLILDPMTSRDGVHAAIANLNKGQKVAFAQELARQVGRHVPLPSNGYATRTGVPADPELERFEMIAAEPSILCKVLLKVIGKWDPKL